LRFFLILPFALLEVYVVVRFGFSEPYSYWFSIPMDVVSFILLQFAIGYGVVKGWADCKMPDNYYLLGLWVTCLLVLFLLPKLFPDSPIS
jgi:hypothetical protein